MTELRHTNRLANEKSPYLLQHAGNPVDWYPWGEEAFAKARREDKPVFLSVGYSTCHWCHVMEHESFEDAEVAALMNDAFVAIKVDREERPDIDSIYMGACQMMTGSGGWPLTIIMTPDKQPFYAGTYIPKDNRYGRIGMMELIPRVVEFWKTKRAEAMNAAEQITEALRQPRVSESKDAPDASMIDAAAKSMSARFDPVNGGFGGAPKFPSPHNLTLLLRHWKRTGDKSSLDMVEKTLSGMRNGGIYDHIGFGFHRYSTDAVWLLPHFEKMLYDQALLVIAYTETYQATGKTEYAETAREVIEYVLRDMTSPKGAFWSAEDADSDGEEGKFYVWSVEEVRGVLDSADADLFLRVFNFRREGNFLEQSTREQTGTNIPHLSKTSAVVAADLGLAPTELVARWESIRQTLFSIRERRIHPYKDDKVLTDWNGLMIAALCKSSQTLDRPEFAQAASRAADFVLTTLRTPEGRLLHRYREGEASLTANLDDYAFMVWGLLELYETTFEVRYLEEAISLNRNMIEHFWDAENGGFLFTPDDGERLLTRPRETYDGAIPSGNSVAMLNLVRLGRITADTELEKLAEAACGAFSDELRRAPSAHSQMMQAVDFLLGPSYEIVICGDSGASDTRAMLRALRSTFLPNKVVVLRPDADTTPPITKVAPYTTPMKSLSGRATAYVCRNFACGQPTSDLGELLKLLREH